MRQKRELIELREQDEMTTLIIEEMDKKRKEIERFGNQKENTQKDIKILETRKSTRDHEAEIEANEIGTATKEKENETNKRDATMVADPYDDKNAEKGTTPTVEKKKQHQVKQHHNL